MANPYHDPRTGKFASKSGLNRENSTITQRGKAKVKEHISLAGAGVVAGGLAVLGAAGAAVLQGVSKPIRTRAHVFTAMAADAAEAQTRRLLAAHGPKIAAAIQAKGSTLVNHVKNMKIAGRSQHNISSVSSRSSSFKPASHLQSETTKVLQQTRAASQRVRVKAPSKRL